MNDRHPSKLAWAVALLLLIAVVAALLLVLPRASKSAEPFTSPSVISTDVPTALDVRVTPAESIGARGSADNRSETDAIVSLRGRVVDDIFDVPVRASVLGGERILAWTGIDGRFAIADVPSGASLRIVATGYEPTVVPEASSDAAREQVVRVTPTSITTVVVLRSDGTPISRAAVTWRAAIDRPERAQLSDWIRADGQVSGAVAARETDATGRCSIPLACPSIATVRDPRTDATRTLRVSPGREFLVEFPVASIRVRFVDALDGRPLAKLAIETWSSKEADAMAQSLVTREDGTIDLAVMSFPVVLRRPGSGVWETELLPLSPDVTRVGFGGLDTMVSIDRRPAADVVEIGVRRCGGRLRLVDERSGELVESLVRLSLRERGACAEDADTIGSCTLTTPRCSFEGIDDVVQSHDGQVVLPCPLVRQLELVPDLAKTDLVIAAAGYAPCVVAAVDVGRVTAEGALDVHLSPARTRSLRLVDTNGGPFRQAIHVHSRRHDVLVWHALGIDDGRHGPFDWYGGDLHVRFGDGHVEDLIVAASDLERVDELTLVVHGGLGAIEVRGVPPGVVPTDLEARLGISIQSTTYRPVLAEVGKCRFEHVPVGSYLVGPASWIEGAELLSFTLDPKDGLKPLAIRTNVVAGETAVVEWQRSWRTGMRLEGRVRVDGVAASQVFLVPAYGLDRPDEITSVSGTPRMVFGRRAVRIPLDREGRYVIEPDDPRPHLLAVCVAWDGPWGTVQGLQVVESLEPGESADIATGSLELRCTSCASSAPIAVAVVMPPASLRHEVTTFHTTRHFSWDPASPLVIDGVPVGVREVKLDGKVHPVVVEGGRLHTVECGTQR